MSPLTFRYPRHTQGRVKIASVGYCGPSRRQLTAHLPESIIWPGVRDRVLDIQVPKEDPLRQVGWGVLEVAARVGLALFVTTGFAAGLNLCTSLTPSDPNMIRACEAVFFWSLALVSVSMQDRA
jgi:hypothetical protein